eukprot:223414_1
MINENKNNEIDEFASFDNIEFEFDDNKNDQIEIAIDSNDIDNNKTKSIINNASNSIKEGFKNLIAIIDNKHDVKYNKPCKMVVSDVNDESETSSDDDDMEISEDENNVSEYKQFYSLKGNQTDVTTDDENNNQKYNTFNAVKTRSIATLLNLSKKLHTVSNMNKYNINVTKNNYKSEIEYSEQETSGMSDDEMKFGLKSGLSRYDEQ